MNGWVNSACTLALSAVVCSSLPPLLAQWPSYPTAAVPRTPDGKPNLLAPAPRTAPESPTFRACGATCAGSEPARRRRAAGPASPERPVRRTPTVRFLRGVISSGTSGGA